MLAVIARGLIVVEHMEGIAVRKIRINAIPCEAAAQPVGAVVHGFHRADDGIAADFAAFLVENARDGAPLGMRTSPSIGLRVPKRDESRVSIMAETSFELSFRRLCCLPKRDAKRRSCRAQGILHLFKGRESSPSAWHERRCSPHARLYRIRAVPSRYFAVLSVFLCRF